MLIINIYYFINLREYSKNLFLETYGVYYC